MDEMLRGILLQAETSMSLSIAGLGAILFSWSRMYQVIENKDLNGFRAPAVLLLPFSLFIVSIVFHYVLLSGVTGFRWELQMGHAQKLTPITDAVAHFRNEYASKIYYISAFQLLSSLLGIVSLALWFVWNVYRSR